MAVAPARPDLVGRAIAFIEANAVADTTVADIAARWGSAHLGRFSATYRRAYGRTPSDRLHQ
jgi:AraC-like DNA-binding protein